MIIIRNEFFKMTLPIYIVKLQHTTSLLVQSNVNLLLREFNWYNLPIKRNGSAE